MFVYITGIKCTSDGCMYMYVAIMNCVFFKLRTDLQCTTFCLDWILASVGNDPVYKTALVCLVCLGTTTRQSCSFVKVYIQHYVWTRLISLNYIIYTFHLTSIIEVEWSLLTYFSLSNFLTEISSGSSSLCGNGDVRLERGATTLEGRVHTKNWCAVLD